MSYLWVLFPDPSQAGGRELNPAQMGEADDISSWLSAAIRYEISRRVRGPERIGQVSDQRNIFFGAAVRHHRKENVSADGIA